MKYIHPNVETRIIDNSFVNITGGGGATTLFSPIFSSKGIDNKLMFFSSLKEYIDMCGEPNIQLYGQAGYNVAEWLTAGGSAYVMRLLPEDASFANVSLAVKLKVSNGGADRQIDLIEHKLPAVQAQNYDSVVAAMSDMANVTKDKLTQDGEYIIPLVTFLPLGRGSAYNNMSVRIRQTDSFDNDYSFRMYTVTIYRRNSSGTDTAVEGPFNVSFYPEARSKSGESLYIADVINTYATALRVADSENIRKGFMRVAEFATGGLPDVNPLWIDVIANNPPSNEHAALTKTVTTKWGVFSDDPDVQQNDPLYSADVVDINKNIYLENGSEGDLETEVTYDTVANKKRPVKEHLLIQCLSGALDPEVMDTKGVDIDVVLDANWDFPVKKALVNFVSETTGRGDCLLCADFQLTDSATVKRSLDFRNNKFNVSDRSVALFTQHGEVYDQYSGSNIKVTPTYVLANKIPGNDNSFGIHYPFVGPRRGIIFGYQKVSFYPNPAEKEKLYKAKINYIERDPRRVNFASQLTSQVNNSALSDISHMRVLFKIKRECERICDTYRMEFNDQATHEALSFELNNYLSQWLTNGACTTCSATVSATEYEKLQRMAKVRVDIVFTGILERIALDLVVGK